MNIYRREGTALEISRFNPETELTEPRSGRFDQLQKASKFMPKSGDEAEVTPTDEADQPAHHLRVNNSFLATYERSALLWLAARTPSAVTPDQLTLLGLFGALLVLVGFAASGASAWFIILAMLGLLLNWLGDSLDGTLARFRKIERPDFGYFLDHSCDLISQTLIFVGLGLSPYFTLFSALLVLSMYLLMTSFTYLKVLILRTHHLSYYGMGATELRLLLAAWALFALWCGPGLVDTRFMVHRVIDLTILALWSLVLIVFMWKVWSDTKRLRPILDK